MKLFVLNVLLAFGWVALTGRFTLGGLAVGLAVGFGALWAVTRLFGNQGSGYVAKTWRWIELIAFALCGLVVASLAVAGEVLTPRPRARPGIVVVPLKAKGRAELWLIANLVSLRPGLLCLDASANGDALIVHAMFADDPEKIAREIAAGIERRVRAALE